MTDEQFAAQQKNIGTLFSSVTGIAESGLKGDKSAVGLCGDAAAAAPDSGRFDRIMNQIGTEERQSPRVR